MKKLLLLLLLSLGLIGNSYSETKVLSYEAQLKAELAAQEMMTEIEAELAHQLALENFQKKLASERPAMMMKSREYNSIWTCKKDYKKSKNSCIKEKLEAILISKGAVKPSQGEESKTLDYLEIIIQALVEGIITEEELNEIMK